MAVDTAAKRFSMMGFGSPIPAMLPVPSGTVGASPRADLLFLYFGLSLEVATAVSHVWGYIVDASRMDFTANAEPQHYTVKVRP